MQSTLDIPRQRLGERPCPIGCDADHHGELPGERSHHVEVATIRTSDGVLCVDLSVRDGEQPEVVLHDSDGGEIRVPEYVALAVGNAVLAAAGCSWAVAS
jgi:hypothetical protein